MYYQTGCAGWIAYCKNLYGLSIAWQACDYPPIEAGLFAECEPIYEELPGWKESTARIEILVICQRMRKNIFCTWKNWQVFQLISFPQALIEKTRLCCAIRLKIMKIKILYLPRRGLEPPRGFPHRHLKPACLPIPPPRRVRLQLYTWG